MKPVITIDERDGTTTLLVTAAIGAVEKTAMFVNDGQKRHRRLKVLSTTGAVLYDRNIIIDKNKHESVVDEGQHQDKAYKAITDALAG